MNAAQWTVPINYRGNAEDVVGQIVGPNAAGEHYIITDAKHDEQTNRTVCQAGLLARGSEQHVSVENQEVYTLLRNADMSKMLGHNPRVDLLPAAFRAPHKPVPIAVHHRPGPMMPGSMGREMVLDGV